MVLLSASPNAPTPQMLVEPVVFSSGYLGELSSGFTAENPERAYYLLVQRASGDFQAWIQANPEDERAKLERYVLVTYPETANLQTALTALANDPNVLYAFEPEEISFSSTWSDRPLIRLSGHRSLRSIGLGGHFIPGAAIEQSTILGFRPTFAVGAPAAPLLEEKRDVLFGALEAD